MRNNRIENQPRNISVAKLRVFDAKIRETNVIMTTVSVLVMGGRHVHGGHIVPPQPTGEENFVIILFCLMTVHRRFHYEIAMDIPWTLDRGPLYFRSTNT